MFGQELSEQTTLPVNAPAVVASLRWIERTSRGSKAFFSSFAGCLTNRIRFRAVLMKTTGFLRLESSACGALERKEAFPIRFR
jgi:hypothetical protein